MGSFEKGPGMAYSAAEPTFVEKKIARKKLTHMLAHNRTRQAHSRNLRWTFQKFSSHALFSCAYKFFEMKHFHI